jgi:hypothetical protein
MMKDILQEYSSFKTPPVDVSNSAVVYHTDGERNTLDELYRTSSSSSSSNPSSDTIKNLVVISSAPCPISAREIAERYPDVDTLVIKIQETAVSPRGYQRSHIVGGGLLTGVKTLMILGYPSHADSPFEYIREIPSVERCLFDIPELYHREYAQEYSITFGDDFERTTLFNRNLREITFKMTPGSEIQRKMADGWCLKLREDDWITYRDVVPEMTQYVQSAFPRIRFDVQDLEFAFRLLAKKHGGCSIQSIKHLPLPPPSPSPMTSSTELPLIEWFEILFDDAILEERVSFKILG